jgi:hypothetical protein
MSDSKSLALCHSQHAAPTCTSQHYHVHIAPVLCMCSVHRCSPTFLDLSLEVVSCFLLFLLLNTWLCAKRCTFITDYFRSEASRCDIVQNITKLKIMEGGHVVLWFLKSNPLAAFNELHQHFCSEIKFYEWAVSLR